MNAARKTCAECGAELTDDDARGLCPRCLLKAGLGSRPDPDATLPFAGGGNAVAPCPRSASGSANIRSSACWVGAAWASYMKPRSRTRGGA